MKITDETFGELTYKDAWERSYKVNLFNKNYDVTLIVEGNDENETIYEEQRKCFEKYEQKKHEINSVTEQLVLKYYQECGNNYDSCNPPQFSELVTVTGIIFPMVYTEKQHVFGFLMECSWDLENGLAVKFVDDKSEVGYQDILM